MIKAIATFAVIGAVVFGIDQGAAVAVKHLDVGSILALALAAICGTYFAARNLVA